jgi:DeoR/GlpR family transcriptional regulator of sugar metabolism
LDTIGYNWIQNGYIKQHRIIQVKDLEENLLHSRNTLKKDLNYLVKEGMILTTGSGSGVKYHCKEEEL